MIIPSGTTSQRPNSPAIGMIRYNSTVGNYEKYHNAYGWQGFAFAGVTPSVEYLVIAGGGGAGAGNSSGYESGGGGAGGLRNATNFTVASGTPITVTVGGGGSVATQGNPSVFGTITTVGGGFGASGGAVGGSGGSGGGGTHNTTAGGSGTSGQGNNGGNGYVSAGGGGGGAGAAGTSASVTGTGAAG
jgi:hypothetical protein